MDVAGLCQLLDSAAAASQRHAALETAIGTLATRKDLHTRPVYAAILRALAAETNATATSEARDWTIFTNSLTALKASIAGTTVAPVKWADRAFFYKGLISCVPAQHNVAVIVALCEFLAAVKQAETDSDDDYSRTAQELRAATEVVRQLAASYSGAFVSLPDDVAGQPLFAATRALAMKNALSGNDGDAIESILVNALFAPRGASASEIDIDATIKHVKQLPAPRFGTQLVRHAARVCTSHAALLSGADDDSNVDSAASLAILINIAQFLVDLRPRFVRGCDSASAISDIAELLGAFATALEAVARDLTKFAANRVALLEVTSLLIAVLVPHQPIDEAQTAMVKVADVLRRVSAAAVAATIPAAVESWDDTLDLAAADKVMSIIISAGVTVNLLRCTEGGHEPVITSDQLTAIAAHASKSLAQLSTIINASTASGKRSRGRRNDVTNEMDRLATVARGLEKRASALATFVTNTPSAETFAVSQLNLR